MIDGSGILWEDPDTDDFVMSISEPYHSGWYDVVVEIKGDKKKTLEAAKNILKENGYYRPRDRWSWTEVQTTYMKKHSSYHQIKVRVSVVGEEE